MSKIYVKQTKLTRFSLQPRQICHRRINKSPRSSEEAHEVHLHGSCKSITDDSRPPPLPSHLFPSSLSHSASCSLLSVSLCFPLAKLRAIMNASIFHLVPSVRPYRSAPSPPAVPIFSCHFFFLPERSFLSLSVAC